MWLDYTSDLIESTLLYSEKEVNQALRTLIIQILKSKVKIENYK